MFFMIVNVDLINIYVLFIGFIPRSQHYFGKRYAENCVSAICDFELKTKDARNSRTLPVSNEIFRKQTRTLPVSNEIFRKQTRTLPVSNENIAEHAPELLQ